ncbi:MAG TPA: hypothetical protein PLR97_03965 [Bacilli bacterium]|nr:hypothetical protein [Bacilli bacterium]
MENKYFVGEIDLPGNTTSKRLIKAANLSDAREKMEKYVQRRIQAHDRYKIHYGDRPIGSFKVRPATTEEILVDDLTNFAGGWDEYNIQGFAEDIIETVLKTLPKEALIGELERRKKEWEKY